MRMIEIRPIADTFVSSVGAVEILSSVCARIVYYVEHNDERVVACKVVIPIRNIMPSRAIISRALTGRCMAGLDLHH